jgi:hypothetical protein
MGRYQRWASHVGTGASWAATVYTAHLDIDIKLHMVLCLGTLVATLWTLIIILLRPDHGLLADMRIRLLAFRAEMALAEQYENRQRSTQQWTETPPGGAHRFGRV